MIPGAIIAILAGYTGLLAYLGRRAQKRHGTSGFFNGNQGFSSGVVFILVTALWASSTVVVELDTAYRAGWSAAWFGVSVVVLSVLVSLLVPLFRKLGYSSNSRLLGERFGPLVGRLSGLVIGFTFPIFAMSNALFASVFLHVLLHWPLWLTMSLTTLILVVYIQFAGLVSLAATQGVNLAISLAGVLVLAVVAHGAFAGGPAAPVPSSFNAWTGVGLPTIFVWFGMNLLNVFSAQAEFQAVTAAKNIRHAQWAVWISAVLLLLVIFLTTAVGIWVRHAVGVVPGGGLAAVASIIVHRADPAEKVVMALGIWSLALTWCGPLLFSGAVSLGRDFMSVGQEIRWTRWALLVEGGLMVAYALARPGDLAWWRVFGLTLRNAGVVAPTLAFLLWQSAVPRWSVVSAIIGGTAVGLGLNAVTGFSATRFLDGINPMWAAQAAAFMVLGAGRWVNARQWGPGALWAVSSLALMAAGVGPETPGAYRGLLLLVIAGISFLAAGWALGRHSASALESVKRQAGVSSR